ncbi:hypothetical protein JCM10212_000577 [Sporobolomyces blumeae]
MPRQRSSSPFDPQALADLEAKAQRLRDKQRKHELQQQHLAASQPKVLVADSPSPRKKRQHAASFFDSTQRPPPPPIAHLFKPETSVSLARREPQVSKFASHESALPRSFVDSLQAAKEATKQEEMRRQRVANRSVGFGFTATSSSSSSTTTGATSTNLVKSELMKPRGANDMRVKARSGTEAKKARIKHGLAKGKGREDLDDDDDVDVMRDIKPSVSAMTRPRNSTRLAPDEEGEPRPARKPKSDDGRQPDDDDDDDLDIVDAPKNPKRRNKDSTVIEDLEMGPIEFAPPAKDPDFNRIEPNSGIKLKERIVTHKHVQALLSDRYHLTPSQIYSLARIDTRRQVHIDVDADFVVIGVLAWKDEIRFLNSNPLAPERKESDERKKRQARYASAARDPLNPDVPEGAEPSTELFRAATKKQKRQRYIRFELVDLSTKQAAASGTGTLNVMLVEADTVDTGHDDEGNEVPIYRGQSGGAYEKYWKESPGAVVAIINPAFLPYTDGKSHTLKPISADSMVVLGRAEHLAFCDAIRKKDGRTCNAWVDARQGTKCSFHVHLAVQRAGVGRAETFSNTASFKQTASIDMSELNKSLSGSSNSLTTIGKKNLTKPGPKPRALGHDPSTTNVMLAGHATYVSGGSRLSGASGGTRATAQALDALSGGGGGGLGLPVSRGSGGFIAGVREGPVVSEEKKKRERERLDRERGRRELRELGKSDGGKSLGGEYLRLARELDKEKKKREREREERERDKAERGKAKKKRKIEGDANEERRKDKGKGKDATDSSDEDLGDGEQRRRERSAAEMERRKVFSSEAVRLIGYNPTLRPGDHKNDKEDDETLRQRLALEGGVRSAIKLSAPPRFRVVSGVDIDPATVASKRSKGGNKPSSAPRSISPIKQDSTAARANDDGGDDDDELLIEGGPIERPRIRLTSAAKSPEVAPGSQETEA